MGFKDYVGGAADSEFEILKKRLQNQKVERMFDDKESDQDVVSAWDMVLADDKGGPCKLQAHSG